MSSGFVIWKVRPVFAGDLPVEVPVPRGVACPALEASERYAWGRKLEECEVYVWTDEDPEETFTRVRTYLVESYSSEYVVEQ